MREVTFRFGLSVGEGSFSSNLTTHVDSGQRNKILIILFSNLSVESKEVLRSSIKERKEHSITERIIVT